MVYYALSHGTMDFCPGTMHFRSRYYTFWPCDLQASNDLGWCLSHGPWVKSTNAWYITHFNMVRWISVPVQCISAPGTTLFGRVICRHQMTLDDVYRMAHGLKVPTHGILRIITWYDGFLPRYNAFPLPVLHFLAVWFAGIKWPWMMLIAWPMG